METYILVALLGACVGLLVDELIFQLTAPKGVLNIDHSDPNKDVYSFEMGDLDKLSKHRHVILQIRHSSDLPRK